MAAITYPIIWLMETLRQWRISERQKAVEELTYRNHHTRRPSPTQQLLLVFPASLLIQRCLPALILGSIAALASITLAPLRPAPFTSSRNGAGWPKPPPKSAGCACW